MEASLYKELSYRVRGFRAVSVLVAVVTVILCLVVGIGCWVLVAGVRENEHLLEEVEAQEKFEVEVVEGEVREPLRLKNTEESMNKVGRVVQHIAEIDFRDGSPVDSNAEEHSALAHLQHAQNSLLQNVPAPAEAAAALPPITHINPDAYKTTFSQRYPVVPDVAAVSQETKQQPEYQVPEVALAAQAEIGQPIAVDGIVGVRIQPPAVEGTATNFMRREGSEDGSGSPNNGHYVKNELSVVQAPAAVFSTSYQRPLSYAREITNPQQVSDLHESLLDHIFNFTSEMASDISRVGIFESLADRASDKYMRETFQWLGDYTGQIMGSTDQPRSRTKRSIFSLGSRVLAYTNYAAFSKFVMNEINAIAEYNLQSRKLSGDPTADFLDSTFWSAPTQSPSSGVLTAATDDWEPQVNKVSLEFIGEILNTLLNMMREFLMKDHVMECLWYMFCQDLNHQAKYADVYGLLARINRYVFVRLPLLLSCGTESHPREGTHEVIIFRLLQLPSVKHMSEKCALYNPCPCTQTVRVVKVSSKAFKSHIYSESICGIKIISN